jgi:hypothetical protein
VASTLSSTDPYVGDTFTYSLVSGTGDSGNASFNISGRQLRSSIIFDYGSQNNYSICIRTTDQGGLFFEKAFTTTIKPEVADLFPSGDFEHGNVTWTEYSSYGYSLICQSAYLVVPPYDGTWAVLLGGALGGANNYISYIQQQMIVPADHPYLSY